MDLSTWALKWSVPAAALQDLRTELGIGTPVSGAGEHSEAYAQSLVRLESASLGMRLWRNNVGATYDEAGNFIRYGLANDSPQLNKLIKSADLIGIDPRPIPHAAVGQPWGRFVSREVKPAKWSYTGTEREVAQLAWAKMVVALGGDAAFATGKGSFRD